MNRSHLHAVAIAVAALGASCATQRVLPGPATTRTAALASPSVSRSAAATPAAAVVARFGDQTITAGGLEARAATRLLSPRQKVYEVETQVLDEMVLDRLVERAAKTAGLEGKAFLKREVDDNVTEPAAAEIDRVLAQYRPRLPADEKEARTQVVAFLLAQARDERLQALKDRLFAEAKVELAIAPPRAEIPIQPLNPSRGPAKAPVTLVELSDFQCPFCGQVQPTITQLLARYPTQIRHIFKHLPLPFHPQARLAAIASQCAAQAGKFWEYHDVLFAKQNDLNRQALIDHASALGLDATSFRACLDAPATAALVDRDLADAQEFTIEGTPRFLINGRMLDGVQSIDAFAKVIDEELKRSHSATSAPAPDGAAAKP